MTRNEHIQSMPWFCEYLRMYIYMFARIFCACEWRTERARQRERKCLQDLMTECSTNMIVITWCLSLGGKGNLTRVITIPPPSVEGRRIAHTSKLQSLSSCSAFLSQDKRMPEYDLLPCESGCKTHSPLTRLCVLLYLMGFLFVHLVLVCFL